MASEGGTVDAMTLEEARAKLKAAPFADFMRIRKELAKQLHDEGAPHLGRLIASENKPTRAAWAVGRVDAEELATLEEARRAAAEAQGGNDGDALREALARYHEAVNGVLAAAKRQLEECGMAAGLAQERAMRAIVEHQGADPIEVLAPEKDS